jgi:DNA-binding GntR family transcriptional regulator
MGQEHRHEGRSQRRGRTNVTKFDALEPLQRETTSSIIANRIRKAIVDGSLPAGMQLGELMLAQQLSVSRGPVREAMQRLIQEGLIRKEPNRGLFVIELDEQDVRDIYLARRTIERTAIAMLTASRDQQTIDALAAMIEEMEKAADSDDWSSVADLDLGFHELLVESTNSKRLVRMFKTLTAETRMCLIRLESLYTPMGTRWHALAAEHRRLLEAIVAGDTEEVVRLLDAHLDMALRFLQAEGHADQT